MQINLHYETAKIKVLVIEKGSIHSLSNTPYNWRVPMHIVPAKHEMPTTYERKESSLISI